jgi:hypothetical protein
MRCLINDNTLFMPIIVLEMKMYKNLQFRRVNSTWETICHVFYPQRVNTTK